MCLFGFDKENYSGSEDNRKREKTLRFRVFLFWKELGRDFEREACWDHSLGYSSYSFFTMLEFFSHSFEDFFDLLGHFTF